MSGSVTLWTVARQAPLSMGILQARILEWVAIPFSRGSSQCRDWTQISCISGRLFTSWASRVACEYNKYYVYKIAYIIHITFILWNMYLYIWKQWTISQCISAHYCLSLMQKSGGYPVCFIEFPCFSRELVTLGDQSSFAVLCLRYLYKMGISMFNNLNTLQLGRFKLNGSIVETHIFHYFFPSLLSISS